MINKLFEKILIQHKKLISRVEEEIIVKENYGFLKPIDKTALKLCLYLADFKCQYEGCNSEENLTTHHLIKKSNRRIMPKLIYITQRHYWANQVILCKKHHSKVDGLNENDKDNILAKKLIKKIRKAFEVN